jgi:4-amino-4-deoxy-L-arabinose transferase-like glycosyltransferase
LKLSRFRLLLLPVIWLLAVTVPHLEQGDFRRDTGRYAAVGLYMWSGGPMLEPHLNPDTPYFNKPPLALWIHGLFLKLFGVHLAVARLPSIVAALGVVCLSVLTAGQIGSQSEALVGGLVLALSYEFVRRTREISLDFWQLLFVMMAVYLVVTAARAGKKEVLIAAGLPLGSALLCKPLVALFTVPLLAIWLCLLGGGRQWRWLVFGTLPLALLVALPWHAYMRWRYGTEFTDQYLHEETINRVKGLVSTRAPYYYLRILAATYWPWLLAVGGAIWLRFRKWKSVREPRRDLVLLGGIWVLYTLLLLNLFPAKQVNYALPLYPMLSWIAAAGLCRIPWQPLRTWYRRGFTGTAVIAVLVLVIVGLAPIQFQKPPDPDWTSLFSWLEQHAITAGNIGHEGLEPDDICYFYLKRGIWLPGRTADVSGTSIARQRDFTLKKKKLLQPDITEPIAFQSGDLVVLGSVTSE